MAFVALGMAVTNLTEKMTDLFENDEDIQEWILVGKLPQDITDIAVVAMQPPEGERRSLAMLGMWPEEYEHVATVIQREFFPDAPPLESGGFMKAFAGGPCPDWLIRGQVADQLAAESIKRGNEVEKKEHV